MSGHYPEGVSGFEYQIAGAQSQYSDVRPHRCDNDECKMFEVEDVEADVEIEYSRGMEYFEWKCPTCGETADVELNVED